MATRKVLAELAARFEERSPAKVALEAVGGVDAAKRVRAGEAFDIVVLASDVIDTLAAEGRVVRGSRVDVAAAGVAVAVRKGATRPDISSPDAVRRAVLAAGSVGYSTGPSGTYLANLFASWGIAEAITDRIRIPPPGTPVGALVARGDLELGFQQLSELIGMDGVDVVGMLPPEIQTVTVFAGGVAATSTDPDGARQLLAFMGGPEGAEIKRRNGMESVGG